MILFVGLLLLAGWCAVMAVRAERLLHAALWLAGVSVFVAIILYMLGAYVMAVIELSLSVGVITILLVFAISMVGADSPDQPVRGRLNVPLVAAMLLLVVGLAVPMIMPQISVDEVSFSETFWQEREGDVIVQISLIFAGVLGVLGLLAETKAPRAVRHHIEEMEQPVQTPEIVIVEEEAELERL